MHVLTWLQLYWTRLKAGGNDEGSPTLETVIIAAALAAAAIAAVAIVVGSINTHAGQVQ
jgi:hypothetical protein